MIETIDGFLSDKMCARWIAWAERQGFGDAPISAAGGPVMNRAVRNNTRVMVDAPRAAEALWCQLAPLLPTDAHDFEAIGLNERLRMYRYDPGQRFRRHRDGHFRRANGEHSRLTFLVYLNDGYEGGQTAFRDRLIEPRTGQALLFSHDLLHEGCEVTAGTKYVLRSDVMYRLPAPRPASTL